jgi:hypothetical protein
MKPVNPRRFVTFLQDHVQVHPATVLHVPEGEGFRVIAEIPEKRDTYKKGDVIQFGSVNAARDFVRALAAVCVQGRGSAV